MQNKTATTIQMIETAVSLLQPIEFEINGFELSYLPGISHNYWPEDVKEAYLGLSHYGIPKIKVEHSAKHHRITAPVNFSSQENVNQAVLRLWEQESKLFFNTEKSLIQTAWTQGNEYWTEICSLKEDPAAIITTSWENFCKFSQNFTNSERDTPFKSNLVYLDNSGGFKCRGAWLNTPILSSVDFEEIHLTLPWLKAVEGESIKYFFGAWNAFAPVDNSIFFFKSCNGNTLVGFVEQSDNTHIVNIYVSTTDCNYAKFFL